MRRVHVLVVGGTGLVGRRLVPALLRGAHRVTVLSSGRRTVDYPDPVARIRASLLDPDAEERLAAAVADCDVVVNTATAMPRDPSAPDAWADMARVRTEGTQRLVRAVRDAGVERLVQMSITMAYPDGGDSWLDESTPFDPAPGRAALVAPVARMEEIVRGLSGTATTWTILRGSRFAGTGTVQDLQRAHLREGRLKVPADGGSFVSMVHVADFVDAVLATLEHMPVDQVFNVSDEPLPVEDYLNGLAGAEGCPLPGRAPDRSPDLPSQRVSSLAARQALGWSPRHGLWSTVD